MKQFFAKRRPVWAWLGLGVIYLLITWLHMGPSLTHANTVVLSSPGDHTAGIMYFSWVHPSSPVLGFSHFTNFPYGENLHEPLALSSLIPSTIHLVLAHLTNLVCAWNILVLFGYMSCALTMFGFMYWLTKNRWIAFFAGYAAAFTPYHAFASHGQVAGLLNALFIGALWQFMVFWRQPSWQKATWFGLLLGIGFYTDGYFILIGGVLLLALWLASIGYLLVARRHFGQFVPQLRGLFLASAITSVFLLPLAWANYHYAAQINSIFGNARGNIAADAQTYSAQLGLYVNHKSLIFLGFSLLVLAVCGVWFAARRHHSATKTLGTTELQTFAAWASLIVALVATWFSLQPITHLGSFTVHNPSSLIIHFTSSWRVFGRLYVLVNLGVIVLAGLGLLGLIRRFPKARYVIIAVSFALMAMELRSFPPTAFTTTFNYQEAPAVYAWLRQNPQVKAIAEYPLDEPPQGAYLSDYYTFQEISGTPMLNSFLPNSPNAPLRRSLAGINDPQTLPVLRALGVSLVNIRPVNPLTQQPDLRQVASQNAGLSKLFSDTNSKHWVDSFLIKPGPVAQHALVLTGIQYFQVAHNADGSATYMVDDDAKLQVVKLPATAANKATVVISFTVSADSDRPAEIIQNDRPIWEGSLTTSPQTIQLEVSADQPITIHNQRSAQLTHVNISKPRVIE